MATELVEVELMVRSAVAGFDAGEVGVIGGGRTGIEVVVKTGVALFVAVEELGCGVVDEPIFPVGGVGNWGVLGGREDLLPPIAVDNSFRNELLLVLFGATVVLLAADVGEDFFKAFSCLFSMS